MLFCSDAVYLQEDCSSFQHNKLFQFFYLTCMVSAKGNLFIFFFFLPFQLAHPEKFSQQNESMAAPACPSCGHGFVPLSLSGTGCFRNTLCCVQIFFQHVNIFACCFCFFFFFSQISDEAD